MKVIKIPFGEGGLGKTSGTKDAPDAVAKELENTYLAENLTRVDYDVESVDVIDDNLAETQENIYKKIKNINEKAVIIGGDHSITFSTYRAFSEKNNNCGMIIFDAHADLDEHTDTPTHEDYLRKLVDDEILDPKRLIIVGLRNFHPIEKEYMEMKGITYYTCLHICKMGLDNVCDEVMGKAKTWDSVYVSIDIDVLDSAFAPGTNHPEPAGITTRELLHFLNRLKFLKKIAMADVVEISPDKDINNITSRLGARLVKELM